MSSSVRSRRHSFDFFQRKRDRGRQFWALQDVSFGNLCWRLFWDHRAERFGQEHATQADHRDLASRRTAIIITSGRIASLLELGAGFHPELTGRENIFLNGSVYGMSRKQMLKRLDEIIDFTELGDFIDMPIKHYSSGMYVRLGFAVAIHTRPGPVAGG